jgi:hypothetical protein
MYQPGFMHTASHLLPVASHQGVVPEIADRSATLF